MSESDTPTQALELANLVEYQNEAAVSRTLIKQSTGSATVFAFDKGQALSEHKVPYDALVYIADGKTRITVSGEFHELGVGEVLIMKAQAPHSVFALTPFKMLLAMVRADEGSQT